MASFVEKEWQCNLGYMTIKGLEVNRGQHTVIAIHGFMDNANSTLCLAEAFPKSRFIAIDLAGHGHSEHRPEGCHYNQLDYVQDLHELIIKLNVSTVTLVGHSLGGIIASIYAALFPENVSALITIDSLGPLTKSEETTHEQIRKAIESRTLKQNKMPPKAVDLDNAIKSRTLLTDLASDYCALILERNIVLSENGSSVWSSDPRVKTQSWIRLTDAQAENMMNNIQCPMLVIGASKSFKTLSKVLEYRASWFSNLQYLCLEGGHHIHMEQTNKTCNAIAEFVGQL